MHGSQAGGKGLARGFDPKHCGDYNRISWLSLDMITSVWKLTAVRANRCAPQRFYVAMLMSCSLHLFNPDLHDFDDL